MRGDSRLTGGSRAAKVVTMDTMHATCVSVFGDRLSGCLLLGPSGSGKSDLAVRLIDGGGTLVADDRVIIAAGDGVVTAAPPPLLAGLLEIRGLGVMTVPFLDEADIRLLVCLTRAADIERMAPITSRRLKGLDIPCLLVDASMASAAARVRWAVRRVLAHGTLDSVKTLVPRSLEHSDGPAMERDQGRDLDQKPGHDDDGDRHE